MQVWQVFTINSATLMGGFVIDLDVVFGPARAHWRQLKDQYLAKTQLN